MNKKEIKTKHLELAIEDLRIYKSADIISEIGMERLKEYEEILKYLQTIEEPEGEQQCMYCENTLEKNEAIVLCKKCTEVEEPEEKIDFKDLVKDRCRFPECPYYENINYNRFKCMKCIKNRLTFDF